MWIFFFARRINPPFSTSKPLSSPPLPSPPPQGNPPSNISELQSIGLIINRIGGTNLTNWRSHFYRHSHSPVHQIEVDSAGRRSGGTLRRRSWGQRSAAVNSSAIQLTVNSSAPHCTAAYCNITQAHPDVHRGGFARYSFGRSLSIFSVELRLLPWADVKEKESHFIFFATKIMLGYSCMVLGQRGRGEEEERGYWTVWGSLARLHNY